MPRTADQTEIKRAYLAAAKQLHPDVGGSEENFKLLQQAYDTLSDPARRSGYDGTLAEEPAALPRLTAADIPWWSTVDPDAPIQWKSRFTRAELAFFGAGGLWAVLAAAGIAIGLAGGAQGVPLLLVLALLLIPTGLAAGRAAVGREPSVNLLATATLIGVIALLLTAIVLAHGQLLAAPFAVFLADGVALAWLSRFYAPLRRRRRINWAANVCRVQPDWMVEASRTTGQQAAAEATFALLGQYLTHIPAVRVFRDLPGFPADVDHAVLCGQRLILISSVRLVTDQSGLPNAVRACRKWFRETEVHGVVLLWPTDPAQRVLTKWTPELAVAVIGPDTLITDIGGWLAEHPTTIHRAVIHKLLTGRPRR